MPHPPLIRGIALGLWILAGLAFLLGALLPGSAGGDLLGPVLLAAAVGWIGLMPSAQTTRDMPARRAFLVLLGVALAFGIALTIVRNGDRRSFLFVAFTALVAAALAYGARHR